MRTDVMNGPRQKPRIGRSYRRKRKVENLPPSKIRVPSRIPTTDAVIFE